MPDFGAYQNEIYLAGLSGRLPSFPMRFDELEAKAFRASRDGYLLFWKVSDEVFRVIANTFVQRVTEIPRSVDRTLPERGGELRPIYVRLDLHFIELGLTVQRNL